LQDHTAGDDHSSDQSGQVEQIDIGNMPGVHTQYSRKETVCDTRGKPADIHYEQYKKPHFKISETEYLQIYIRPLHAFLP
jgi:hypothetical protein